MCQQCPLPITCRNDNLPKESGLYWSKGWFIGETVHTVENAQNDLNCTIANQKCYLSNRKNYAYLQEDSWQFHLVSFHHHP